MQARSGQKPEEHVDISETDSRSFPKCRRLQFPSTSLGWRMSLVRDGLFLLPPCFFSKTCFFYKPAAITTAFKIFDFCGGRAPFNFIALYLFQHMPQCYEPLNADSCRSKCKYRFLCICRERHVALLRFAPSRRVYEYKNFPLLKTKCMPGGFFKI